MSAALLVLLACCSSSAGAGAFFGGFIPGTSSYAVKNLKKLSQNVITGNAKPVDCEKLYNYMKEIEKGKINIENGSDIFSEQENHVINSIHILGKGGKPGKICDKSIIDSKISLFKSIQTASEGDENIPDFCNEFKDLSSDKSDEPILYWDVSKGGFVSLKDYIKNAFDGKYGAELEDPVEAKCKAVDININDVE
jgi:hypothetical protein